MSRLDYSKWDHIEISDDEDDTHPNIDTPSLFRWRHQARVERMEKEKKEREELEHGKTDNHRKMLEMKKKLKEAEEKEASEELSKLKIEVSELEKQEAEWTKKEEDLKKKERLTPWNIDTICKEGKSKTIINKSKPKSDEELTDDQKWQKQKSFIDKNEDLVKKFGNFSRYEDSQNFLAEHPELACEETANYLVLYCIDLVIEEKEDLMSHVAHQTIVMQFILELAKSLETDPRNCIRGFFSRISLAEKQYMDAFNDELEAFKKRVKARAQARIDEAMAQAEEEEKQKRMGPGGLDPVEVFESLPQDWQECFEKKDIALLQETIKKIPKEEAEYHLKRCIDSGLWVPDSRNAEAGDGETASGVTEEVTESAYDQVD